LIERALNLRVAQQVVASHTEESEADIGVYLLELFDEGNNNMANNGQRGAYSRFPQMHLQPFDGDPRRLREFRRTLDIVFSASPGTTEAEQLALVIGLLSGDAKGWWMSKPDNYQPANWRTLLTDLQDEMFGGSQYALWAELHLRALRAGESLNTYKYDIANLCEMLALRPPEQVGCFIRGLPEQVRNAVSANDPRDLDTAFHIARRVMEYSSPTPLKTTLSTPSFPSIFGDQKGWGRDKESDMGGGGMDGKEKGVLNRELADLTQQLGKLALHLMKEKDSRGMGQQSKPAVRSFGTGGQIICGKCLKPGHIQRNCTNPPDPSAIRCGNCSFYGHKESECRKPPRIKTDKSHLLEIMSGFNSGELPLKFDDGHDAEDLPDEPSLHSGFMGFTLTSPASFPPCEVWVEQEDVVSAPFCVEPVKKVRFVDDDDDGSDADSESSFEVTASESEDLSGIAQAEEVHPAKMKKMSHPPKKPHAKDEPKEIFSPRKAQAKVEVREGGAEGKIEHRKELREERRASNYRVLDAVLGPQVPVLSEVGGKLSYFRKDAHDWVDSRILHYLPRKRASPKDAAFSKLESLNVSSVSHGAWTYDAKAIPSPVSHGQLRHIMVGFGEVCVPAIVDTGSQISVLSYSFVRELGLEDRISVKNAPRFTGSDLQSHKAKGTLPLTMTLGRLRVKTVFTVVDGPSSSFKVLIGQDILGPTYATCCNDAMEVRFKVPDGTYVHCPFVKVSKNV
jgi:hypothetical protein